MQHKFIKAWDLRINDTILIDHDTYIEAVNVIDIVRHISYAQGEDHVVLVGLHGSYSPKWKVFKSKQTMKIERREQ